MSEAAPGPEAPDQERGTGADRDAAGASAADGSAAGVDAEGRDAAGVDGGEPRRVVVTRRRAPRYRAFAVTGGLVGLVVGLAIALSRPPQNSDYTERTIAGYFGVSFMLFGALVGLGVALLAERRR